MSYPNIKKKLKKAPLEDISKPRFPDYDPFRYPPRDITEEFDDLIDEARMERDAEDKSFYESHFLKPVVRGSRSRKARRKRGNNEAVEKTKKKYKHLGLKDRFYESSDDSENDDPSIAFRGNYSHGDRDEDPMGRISSKYYKQYGSKSGPEKLKNLSLYTHIRKAHPESPIISASKSIKPAARFATTLHTGIPYEGEMRRIDLDPIRREGFGIYDTDNPETFYGEGLHREPNVGKTSVRDQELGIYAPDKELPRDASLGWYKVRSNISPDEYDKIKKQGDPTYFVKKFTSDPLSVKPEIPVRYSFEYHADPRRKSSSTGSLNIGRSDKVLSNLTEKQKDDAWNKSIARYRAHREKLYPTQTYTPTFPPTKSSGKSVYDEHDPKELSLGVVDPYAATLGSPGHRSTEHVYSPAPTTPPQYISPTHADPYFVSQLPILPLLPGMRMPGDQSRSPVPFLSGSSSSAVPSTQFSSTTSPINVSTLTLPSPLPSSSPSYHGHIYSPPPILSFDDWVEEGNQKIPVMRKYRVGTELNPFRGRRPLDRRRNWKQASPISSNPYSPKRFDSPGETSSWYLKDIPELSPPPYKSPPPYPYPLEPPPPYPSRWPARSRILRLEPPPYPSYLDPTLPDPALLPPALPPNPVEPEEDVDIAVGMNPKELSYGGRVGFPLDYMYRTNRHNPALISAYLYRR